jgi:hypothetical protein
LQGRFDDTGDTDRDFVLKLECVFERTVETIGRRYVPVTASIIAR